MIPRYTRPELAAIWDPRTRYRIWFEIEAHAADAMAELGIIPKSAAQEIWESIQHWHSINGVSLVAHSAG